MGRRPQKRPGGRGAWAAPARGAWDPGVGGRLGGSEASKVGEKGWKKAGLSRDECSMTHG